LAFKLRYFIALLICPLKIEKLTKIQDLFTSGQIKGGILWYNQNLNKQDWYFLPAPLKKVGGHRSEAFCCCTRVAENFIPSSIYSQSQFSKSLCYIQNPKHKIICQKTSTHYYPGQKSNM